MVKSVKTTLIDKWMEKFWEFPLCWSAVGVINQVLNCHSIETSWMAASAGVLLRYKTAAVVVLLFFQSTPLHLAAGYNRVKTVQLLLQHGADVHAKDKG